MEVNSYVYGLLFILSANFDLHLLLHISVVKQAKYRLSMCGHLGFYGNSNVKREVLKGT